MWNMSFTFAIPKIICCAKCMNAHKMRVSERKRTVTINSCRGSREARHSSVGDIHSARYITSYFRRFWHNINTWINIPKGNGNMCSFSFPIRKNRYENAQCQRNGISRRASNGNVYYQKKIGIASKNEGACYTISTRL